MFGYDLVDGELVVNPIEAEIVKRIFTLYQRNKSTRAIAKQFNKEGVPTKRDTPWAETSVYYIIANPVYCGNIRWNFHKARGNRTYEEVIVEGSHEPIISPEEFERVVEMRAKRKREGKGVTTDFAFTGVLRCGRCGSTMYGSSRQNKTGRKKYYKCFGRFNLGTCDMPIIAEESVSEAYAQLINMDELEQLKKMVKVNDVEETRETDKLKEQLTKELEDVRRKKDRWFKAFEAEAISALDLKNKTSDLRVREEYLMGELNKLPQKEESRKSPEEIISQLNLLQFDWISPSDDDEDEALKKQFLNEVYNKIVIDTDITEARGGPGRRVPVFIKEWEPN